MANLDLNTIHAWVDEQWESHALPSRSEFIEIPALSPAFDEACTVHRLADLDPSSFMAVAVLLRGRM